MLATVLFCAAALESLFLNPPHEAKPWCYWWWQNGHADEKSITQDLEAMRDLGFGGVLMSDARGYWDDDDHVRTLQGECEVMSPEWRRLVLFAIRECRRLGLEFTANVATCGGALKGPWKVGADAPKRLMCRVYPADAEFERPNFPHWKEIGVWEVTADCAELAKRGWFEAGDGTRTQFAGVVNRSVERKWIPSVAGPRYRIRFGSTTIPGHDCDVDVLDPAAIERHFNRFSGALMDAAGPDLVGEGKTFSHVYSVSWEGLVPQWTPNFRADFRKYAGYDIDPYMPVLAGVLPAGVDPEAFMRDYRRARNEMFRDNFYGTLRRLAAARGVRMYSENGGPWHRDPELFREADQLSFLGLNDMPQGEFWVRKGGVSSEIFNPNDPTELFNTRGPVSAGHVYGRNRISLESFTHMTYHWSMSPFELRRAIDKVFADGGNHVVWHTFSLCPDEWGAPGFEYFAGTHVNRNVTWHREARAFIAYLTRCEALLQAGEPVVDIPVKAGPSPYAHWGRLRDRTPDGEKIPSGYNYDLVNDAMWEKVRGRYPAELPAKPDLEGPWAFAHRRLADGVRREDVYFLQGFEKGRAIFRVSAKSAVLFDAVTGRTIPLASERTSDGRTAVELDLRETGSAVVALADDFAAAVPSPVMKPIYTFDGAWGVSFAYHRLAHARHLPKARSFERLSDFSRSNDPDLRFFAGRAAYEKSFALGREVAGAAELSLGALPSGVARVFVNGTDCGVVWCAPWKAVLPPGTLKMGSNALRIEYVNNWHNRLIGDCSLDPLDRVTRSCLKLVDGPRGKMNTYSGYSSEDALQPSGLLGPVILFAE